MNRHAFPLRRLCAVLLAGAAATGFAQTSTLDGVYSASQAADGATLYTRSCIECHGATLRGGEGGPALVGPGFWSKWAGQSLGALYQITASTMPVNNRGGFSPAQYASLIAFMLQQNGLPAGTNAMPADAAQLVQIKLDESQEPLRVTSLQAGPSAAQRVINAEWTNYHGDTASTHYAPIDYINKDNVQNLEIAWRWYTTNHGPQPEFNYEATPLMVDGVLYTTAGRRRDIVAIDPVTGESLWMYRFDEGSRGGPRVNSGRGLSVWRKDGQTRLVMVTPGYQMISLDAATGRPDLTFGDNGVVDLRVGLEDRFEVDDETAPVAGLSGDHRWLRRGARCGDGEGSLEGAGCARRWHAPAIQRPAARLWRKGHHWLWRRRHEPGARLRDGL